MNINVAHQDLAPAIQKAFACILLFNLVKAQVSAIQMVKSESGGKNAGKVSKSEKNKKNQNPGGAGEKANNSKAAGNDYDTFRNAFNKLDNDRLFVPITELRKELKQWSREKFDETLSTLRKERKIQLHMADRSKMTEREWKDTYVDENGFHMRRVTWIGPKPKKK